MGSSHAWASSRMALGNLFTPVCLCHQAV